MLLHLILYAKQTSCVKSSVERNTGKTRFIQTNSGSSQVRAKTLYTSKIYPRRLTQ